MFIKVKEYVINASAVRDFVLNNNTIRVHYNNGDAITIVFDTAEEADYEHDDIYRLLNGKSTKADEAALARAYEMIPSPSEVVKSCLKDHASLYGTYKKYLKEDRQ